MKLMNPTFILSRLLLTALALLLLSATTGLANEEPVQIEADKMVSVEKTQTVVFTGNVDAKQGEVRIRADKMTVFYTEGKSSSKKKKKSKSAQQIEKITCEGNVEVTSVEWLGTSDVMHYFASKELVQLIGNAKAYKDQNMVKGERIDYHLDTGKSEVFGDTGVIIGGEESEPKKPGRVKMTILEE